MHIENTKSTEINSHLRCHLLNCIVIDQKVTCNQTLINDHYIINKTNQVDLLNKIWLTLLCGFYASASLDDKSAPFTNLKVNVI